VPQVSSTFHSDGYCIGGLRRDALRTHDVVECLLHECFRDSVKTNNADERLHLRQELPADVEVLFSVVKTEHGTLQGTRIDGPLETFDECLRASESVFESVRL
jgi:hypothetical protein